MGVATEVVEGYIIVEIHLGPDLGAGVRAASLIVEDGPEYPPGHFRLDLERLDRLIADPTRYGQALGEMLFAEDSIGKQFKEILAHGETARILLHLKDANLDQVPWERVFYPAGTHWYPLGVGAATPFSRWVGRDDWRQLRAVVQQNVRILVVIASGDNFDGDVVPISPQEKTLIRQTLNSLPGATITFLESDSDNPPTIRRLRNELQRGYHAVHFCCHGRVRNNVPGELLLETDDGTDPWLNSEQLVEAIRASRTPPRLCFLSACESAKRLEHSSLKPIGAQVASRGPVAAVVAMTDSVDMITAHEFTAAFYTRLLDHGSADRAMNEARESVRDKMDWGVPVLFLSARDGFVLKKVASDHDELIASSLNDRVKLLVDRHAPFAGRHQYIEAMNQYLSQRSSGYLFITGASGIGKTALLANWVKSLQASPAYFACYHFISQADDLADENYTISNLCEQLRTFYHLQQELPSKTSELRGWYRRLLTKRTPETGKKLVVVLDGLDEAKGWKPGPDLFPPNLSEGIFIVFSARASGQNWLADLKLTTSKMTVLELLPLGASEISELLRCSGDTAALLANDLTFVTALFERSDGDPLYLHFLVMDVLEGKISSLKQLVEWPSGLDGYLERWWDELTELSNTEQATSLIGYLTVSKGRLKKLDLLQLQDGQALNPVSLHKLIQESRRFLIGDDEEGYSLGHLRFREYIARKHIPAAIQEHFRQHLLRFCSSWKQNHSTYAISHYSDHLSDERASIDQLENLLADFEYLQARLGAGDIKSLISAYDALPATDELRAVQAALAASGEILTKDKTQLPSHLLGRLLGSENRLINDLLVKVKKWHPRYWLKPLTKSLASSNPLLRTLTGHSGPVLKVALLDSQRRRVVSISEDQTLRVWHIETGETIRILQSEARLTKALAVLDSRRVVCASIDGDLYLWDLEKGYVTQKLQGHTGSVEFVAVVEDNKIVSGSADRTLRVWNLETGETLRILSGHSDCVTSGAVLDSWRVISGSSDNTVRLWDMLDGETSGIFAEHTAPIKEVAIIAHDKAISGSADGILAVWDINSFRAIGNIQAHDLCIEDVTALDSDRVMTASEDGTLRIWNIESRESSAPFKGHLQPVHSVARLDQGRVISASADKTLKIWDTKSDFTLRAVEGHSGSVVAIAALDQQRIVSGAADGVLRIWDLGSHKTVDFCRRTKYGIRSLAVLSARTIIAASEDENLWLWDLETGEIRIMESEDTPAGLVEGLATIDPVTFAAASEDNTLGIWDLSTGQIQDVLEGHADRVLGVAVLDGRRLVSASADGTLRIWDISACETTKTLIGHTEEVEAVAVIDKRRIMSASADTTVRIWDVETGTTLRTIDGHTDWVLGVAALDRRRVASASADGNVCVWDSQSGDLLANFRLDGEATAVAAAGDQETLVVGDAEGRIHFLYFQRP